MAHKRQLILIAALMTTIASAQEIPPPTEIYYKTDFPAWEFEERRQKVLDAIGEDGVALIQGAGPVRGFAMFRQTNEMYYLTGVEVPRAMLLIDGRTGESKLYLPHRDERFERSEGKILSAEDFTLVNHINGIDSLHGPEELINHLQGAKTVYTPFEPAEGDTGSRDELTRSNRLIAEDPWDARPSREQHLISLIKERVLGAEIKDLSPILDPLRVVKSTREREQLRRAGRLSALALIEAAKTTEPGVMEWELDAVARYMYYVGGAQGLGYRSITASGPNILNGHYYRNNRRLQKEDMMLMDFAPDVGYYTSDIGRMWPVDGTYPPFMRELYGFVVEYHKIALSVLRAGETVDVLKAEVKERGMKLYESWTWSKEIYREGALRMVETGGGTFSHGVGMAVHDIGSYRTGVLKPGMVFSIDPQLRIPEEGLYIRIEDTIAITENGHQNFTALAPMDLDEMEELMKQEGMLQQLPWAVATPNSAVTKPPARLNTDPFYQKYLSGPGGIPVLSSRQVSDAALTEAQYLMSTMLQNRPDVAREMAARDVRVVIMAFNEMTTDVPEQSGMERPFWDERARGLGGRLTSAGAENILAYPWDRYIGENILIHEFAHCIAGQGLRRVDDDFQARLNDTFNKAKDEGLWANTYAMTNSGEYWAEAIQSYFDCNRSADPPNGVHGSIDTREELAEYDPRVYKLIEDSLGKIEWRYKKPVDRNLSGAVIREFCAKV